MSTSPTTNPPLVPSAALATRRFLRREMHRIAWLVVSKPSLMKTIKWTTVLTLQTVWPTWSQILRCFSSSADCSPGRLSPVTTACSPKLLSPTLFSNLRFLSIPQERRPRSYLSPPDLLHSTRTEKLDYRLTSSQGSANLAETRARAPKADSCYLTRSRANTAASWLPNRHNSDLSSMRWKNLTFLPSSTLPLEQLPATRL